MSDPRGFGQNLLRGFREVVDEGRARFGPLGENLLRDTERQFRTNPAGFIPPHAQQAMGNAAQALEFTDAGDVKAYQDTTSAALDAVARGSWADAAMNAPGVAASMASLMLPGFGFGGAIKAYHGSPYDFDKFDNAKIGTGEGNQSFGHGLYFAESEGVARSYRDALSDRSVNVDGAALFSDMPWMRNEAKQAAAAALQRAMGRKLSGDDAVKAAMQDLTEQGNLAKGPSGKAVFFDANNALPQLLGKQWEVGGGKMYEVNIDAEPEQFLDWDLPLSDQPKAVQDHFSKMGIKYDRDAGSLFDDALLAALTSDAAHQTLPKQPVNPDGSSLYRRLGGGSAASQNLQAGGVRGIRYLDQGSRGKGDGTRNYVVFDPNQVEIKKKY